jgi:hypothetical protein
MSMHQFTPIAGFYSSRFDGGPRDSRLALALGACGITTIPLCFLVAPIMFGFAWGGSMRFVPVPSFPAILTTGPIIPYASSTLALAALSDWTARRIHNSSGLLLGRGWAWTGVVLWSLIAAFLLWMHISDRCWVRSWYIQQNMGAASQCVFQAARETGIFPTNGIIAPDFASHGIDYLLAGFPLPTSGTIKSSLILVEQHDTQLDGSRWVEFADGSEREVSRSDFRGVWAANNAARVSSGLIPLPPP